MRVFDRVSSLGDERTGFPIFFGGWTWDLPRDSWIVNRASVCHLYSSGIFRKRQAEQISSERESHRRKMKVQS
jgi:hypothetical protein